MQQQTLANGLKVLVEENHSSKVVAAQVWVGVGSADELPEEAGLAHVHEHMLFKGTERRKVGEIAQTVEAAGGDINAFTSFDQTVYHVTIASREVDVALDILADAVQHSAFDAEELSRELEVVLEEVRRGKDSPGRVSSEILFRTIYNTHNYRNPVIGFVETIEKFTREQILNFYQKWYRPENMVLVVAGDVAADEVFKKAEKLFEDAKPGQLPERPRHDEPRSTEIRFASERADIQETHLNVAWPGPSLKNPDTPYLDLLSILLGTGESSRLYRTVKRGQDLVSDCYAYAYTPQDPGLVGIGAQKQGEKVPEAFKALLKETLRMRYVKPTQQELDKARTVILADNVYGKETVQGIARKLGYFELIAGGTEFEEKYQNAIKAATLDDLHRVAKKYLDPEILTVTMYAPEALQQGLDLEQVKALTAEVVQELDAEYQVPKYEAGDDGVAQVTLENGAQLLVLQDSSVPLVSIRTAAKGGLLDETDENNGVTSLTGELLVRGTEKYSAERLIQDVDSMAGAISGQSGRNSLGLRGDFLKESFQKGFEYYSSCLLEPIFPEEELAREKKNQLEAIIARKDNPSAIAFKNLAQTLYDAEHPYSRPLLGTEESVGNLSREHVLDAYHTQLRPDDLTVVVVGDVDIPTTIQMVQQRIGRAQPHEKARRFQLPAAPQAPDSFREVLTHKDKQQAQLVFGFLGLDLRDERRPALDVLCSVMSGQSGRLFMELRDKQSLAYSVGAFSLEGLSKGYFATYIGTAPEKLATAEEGIRLELDKLKKDLVRPDELAKAQRYLIGAHEIALQRATSRAGTMALNQAYELGYDEHLRYAERIEAVSLADVQSVSRQIIDFDHSVRSIVTPEQ